MTTALEARMLLVIYHPHSRGEQFTHTVCAI